MPRRRMYWETAKDTHNILVSEAMSRNRFEHISSNIHCCNNDELNPTEKFAKVRPLFCDINEKFMLFAPVTENHCVDEVMVPSLVVMAVNSSLEVSLCGMVTSYGLERHQVVI